MSVPFAWAFTNVGAYIRIMRDLYVEISCSGVYNLYQYNYKVALNVLLCKLITGLLQIAKL